MTNPDFERYATMTYQDLRSLAGSVFSFLLDDRFLPVNPDEARDTILRALAIYGRGYVPVGGAASGEVEIRFDLETANERFHEVSVLARRREILKPNEIVRLRAACWRDCMRVAEAACSTTGGAAMLHDVRDLPPLSDAIVDAAAAIVRRAEEGALDGDPELARSAPEMKRLLVGPAPKSTLAALPSEAQDAIAVKTYEAVVRADRCALRDAQRGSFVEPWRDIVEARDRLRACLFGGKVGPYVLAALALCDARDWMVRENPLGIEAFLARNPGLIDRLARGMRHLPVTGLAKIRRALITDPQLGREGVGRLVSKILVSALCRHHPAGTRLMQALEEADPELTALLAPFGRRQAPHSSPLPSPLSSTIEASRVAPARTEARTGLGRRLLETLLME